MTENAPNPMDTAQTDSLRTASMGDMFDVLKRQDELKSDFVATASSLHYEQGLLVAREAKPVGMNADGTEHEEVKYIRLRPTDGFEDDVCERLGIPHKYMEKMRNDAITAWNETNAKDDGGDLFAADLLDHNVNHWLQRDPERSFLVRTFHTDDESQIGVARALRSDRFGIYDHMDMLAAMLNGVTAAGVAFEVKECRLTPSKLHVRITSPEITAAAPTWLKGYRSPFEGDGGGSLHRAEYGFIRNTEGKQRGDLVEAGVDFRNSETGDGSWWIAPYIVVLECGNGQTVTRDAFRKPHQASKMEEGIVRYGDDTHQKCQPPGTRVLLVDERSARRPGRETKFRLVPIEDVRVGDRVASYSSSRVRLDGRPVTSVGATPFSGRLIVVTTEVGHATRYTPNHRCIAEIGEAFDDRWIVYLMRRGQSYRVGMTAGRTQRGDGTRLTARMREQRGDAMWVLSTHTRKADALAAELYTAWRFGIPQASFTVQSEKDLRGQAGLDAFWMKVGDVTGQATACLESFGRMIAYPIIDSATSQLVTRRATEVRACNLIDGMSMLDASRPQHGMRCERAGISVSTEFYEGPVWSLDVADHQTYIADGLVTHNSLELIKLQSRDTVSTFLNIDYLEKVIAEIEAKAGAPVKDVDDTIKRVAKKFLFSEEERNTIFEAFIQSGQVNAGGVMHAVTAAAQATDSPGRATHLEEAALDVLDFVAAG